jgi:hypothetical protein
MVWEGVRCGRVWEDVRCGRVCGVRGCVVCEGVVCEGGWCEDIEYSRLRCAVQVTSTPTCTRQKME